MTIRERIQLIVGALSDATNVTLPVAELREWLSEDGAYTTHDDGEAVTDLTCEDMAAKFGRTAACVRGWCRAGSIPGAYRLNGREWRVPTAGLRAFLNGQRNGGSAGEPRRTKARGRHGDLSAWRDVATGEES